MKYRLGLDLGVGSIGSAIIELDDNNNPKDIKDAGVRIFEVSEGAEDRRVKRTARKNLVRTKKRLELLAKKLFENGLWVNDNPEGTDKLKSKSPYKIRYDGISEKLANINYIGRTVLHLAKHRGAGFVSAKEESEEEVLEEGQKSKAKLDSYEQMYEYLKKSNSKTMGEFFYKKIMESHEKKEPKLRIIRRKQDKNTKKAIVDFAIPRYLVKDEFNLFWDTQAKFFSQMNKDGLKQEIYDILFYERPAAPYATGKCIYIRDEDRICKAHPLAEMRRIYEETNNIRISSNDMGKRKLSLEERDKIINELLLNGQNAGKQSIKKTLGLGGLQTISLYEDRNIKAFLYSRPEFREIEYLQKLSDDEFADFIEFLENPRIDANDENSRLLNEDKLIERLKPLLKIDNDKKIGALLSKLPKNRTNLGKTATKKILEELKKDVITHREITDILAKDDIRFKAAEEIAREMQGKCFSLPYYGEILQTDTQPLPPLMIANNETLHQDEIKWGKIANPAVHMILNQLRLVVNDIIKTYGRPYDINIELGRDVGMSTKKKQEEEAKQNKNEKINERAKNYLLEIQLPITGKNILKYKLAEEQGWKDAYNTSRNIPAKFDGFEIEHIIPQAKGGTDTYNNLALVNANDNLNKGDRFAYDYFLDVKEPEEIREIIKNAESRLKFKAWRFQPDAKERFSESGDSEETNRYLTDTRYVAKISQRYLKAIIDCSDTDEAQNRILPIRGQQTSTLRKKWWLEGLEYNLMGLDIPRYIDCKPFWLEQDNGTVIDGINKPDIDGNWHFYNKTKNPQWDTKPRIDHRHHAMDAITAACADNALLQKMSNRYKIERFEPRLPLTTVQSTADFRRKVIDVLKNVKVSHKPDHSKAGQFHEETIRVKLCQNPENKDAIITYYRRNISDVVKSAKDLNKLLVPTTIKDEWHPNIAEDRIKQAKLVQDFELYMNTAEQILIAENEKGFDEGKKTFDITEGRILQKAFKIIQEKELWKSAKFKNYENSSSLVDIAKHGVSYLSGNNHCVDFYEKGGKIGWEVINRFNANQKDFIPDWKKNNAKFIWSIQKGDLLELDTPEEWQSYTNKERCIAKIKKFNDGQTTIDYFTDARMTSPKDKNLKHMFVNSLRKGLSYFTKNKARKIELTAFGKMKKKHKVLWDGKKTEA